MFETNLVPLVNFDSTFHFLALSCDLLASVSNDRKHLLKFDLCSPKTDTCEINCNVVGFDKTKPIEPGTWTRLCQDVLRMTA